MIPPVYTINDRFTIVVAEGTVTDNSTGQTSRLEPRLVRLLNLLVENAGQVTGRSSIITSIWEDYPGAGESLNQAISFLRKALDDDGHQLIRTIPKKGYQFQGKLTEPGIKQVTNNQKKWPLVFLVAALVLVAIVVTRLLSTPSDNIPANGSHEAMRVRDSIHQASMK